MKPPSVDVVAVVVAKAPVPGFAKTRLAQSIGDDAAAELAAAALLDTIDLVASWPGCDARLLMITGDLDAAACNVEIGARLASGWRIVGQQGTTFGDRLSHAHRVARAIGGQDAVVVQIGMDTPQLSHADLGRLAAAEHDVVIGPADDGGWWGIGVREPAYADRLATIATSTPTTGADTASAMTTIGATVGFVNQHRDIDTIDDAHAVAASAPDTRFAAAFRELAGALR